MLWVCSTKTWKRAKLGYMDISYVIVDIKTKGIYGDIEKGLEARFDTSNYELDRPWPKRKKE